MSNPTKDSILVSWCNHHACWYVDKCYHCGWDMQDSIITRLHEKIARLEKDL